MDLRLLKKLAFSSVEYGGMSEAEKGICLDLMEDKWNAWISSVSTVQETENTSVISSFPSVVLVAMSLLPTILVIYLF
jgi:hypothetical protein